MSPPRPEENGCVISVHHCQSLVPAQLADPRERDERASDGRMGRRVERAMEEKEEEEEGEEEEEEEEVVVVVLEIGLK